MYLLSYAVYLLFCRYTVSTLSEYMQIETGVEYYPASSSSIIGQVGNIPSLFACEIQCMQNDQCFTATFYPTLHTCSLFTERGASTVPFTNGSATVITMIDRFPTQCSTYMTINDPTRLVTYTATTNLCDQTFFSSSPTWVRFVAPGGTQIPTFFPGQYHCGTAVAGWMDGSIPGIGGVGNVHVCWPYSGNCSYRDSMQIVNCEEYYVYGLCAPGSCDFRFCTV